jgi:uncharacterized protein YycO
LLGTIFMQAILLKKLCLIFISATLISACSTGTRFDPKIFFKGNKPQQVCKEYQSLTEEEASAKMNIDIYELQQNVERSMVFREKVTEHLDALNELTRQEKPFPPELIDKLSQTVQKEIDLMRPVITAVAKHGCWLEPDEYQVSKTIKMKGNLIVLATLVALYDEYGTVMAVINENDRLRRFLNNSDSGYERDAYLLESMTDMFVDLDLLSYTTDLVKRYNEHEIRIKEMAQENVNLHYLVQIIEQSKSYPVLLEMDFFDAASYRRKVRRNVTSDTLRDIGRSVVNGLSKGFSNAVGDYEERKGLLYDDVELEQLIAKQLQIGDILLEKTPFRLTDSMIPGHWGHAAIWIGTEQELKAIDLWEHPLVTRYHEQIKRSELVAESLRTGTTLSSLSHFLNIDDLGVVRSREPMSDQQMRETIVLALRQIGKEYDFNFDVETTDKIVCSQLVYLSYSKINWPTESTLGRYTISPDNIAVKTLDDGPFKLMIFYHDGKLVTDNALTLMEELMQQE